MGSGLAGRDEQYARVVSESRRYCEQHVPGWSEMAPYMQDYAVLKLAHHTMAETRHAAAPVPPKEQTEHGRG